MPADSDGFLSLNTEKIKSTVSLYKLPLFFGIAGIILLVSTLILLVKSTFSTPGVEFSLESTSSATTKIYIDIEGSVVSPGVFEFLEGERVEDAIKKAGGLTEKADTGWIVKNLNRAAKLADGGKIYIPSISEDIEGKSPSSAKASEGKQNSGNTLGVTTGLINVNTASQKDLESLPGIGPVTAVKIIEGRPYSSVEDLKNKKIVGASVYEKIKDKICVY